MAAEDSYPKLLSLAVHELRTPASVVGGYLRMLIRDHDSPPSARHLHLIEEAEKSCARMVALIAEMSEVAKIDEGVAPFASRPLDLFSLVAEVAESVHEGQDRDVLLKVSGDSSGATRSGDPDRLRTAFGAVFRAVLRETAGPATIVADRRITPHDGTNSAVITVAEEAAVQSADKAPAVAFDDKRGGTGLSLAIARRVVEAHGGRLLSPDFGNGPARGAAVIAIPL